MHRLSFDYKGKTRHYQAPRSWNELTAVQLIRWAAVAFGKYSAGDQLRLAIVIAYGLEANVFKLFRPHQQVQLSPNVAFLFTPSRLTRWLLPSLRVACRRYHGPDDFLANLTAHEFFNYTEVLYQRWIKGQDIETLEQLCAVLYREKRRGEVDDDVRRPLTEAGISIRSRRFSHLHGSIKQAILLNYEGCRQHLIEKFDAVFDAGRSGKVKPEATDLVLALSGPQLGTYNEARHINLYKFLEHTVRLIRQAEETTTP